jgi:hypothetical protein
MEAIRAFSGRLAAVALLTLREVTRKRFFLVLGLFAVGLISVFGLAPGLDPSTTSKVLITWIFRAIAFFLAILAVFIAGTSIPLEIDRRQIYTLASKPVAKATILLGKFAGFAVVLLVSLATLGVVSILMLRGAQLAMTFREPKEGEPRTFSLEAYPRIQGSLRPIRAHFLGDDPTTARVFRLRGDSLDSAFRFEFDGLDPLRFEMAIPCRLKFGVGRKGTYDYSTDLVVIVTNPETGVSQSIECPQVLNNEWYTLPQGIPRSMIGSGGRIHLEVRRIEADEYLHVERNRVETGQEGVVLFESPEWFETSMFKSLGMVFLEGLFLLAVVLSASSFLSAPVTLFLGLSLFIVGSVHGFLQEAVEDTRYAIAHQERSHEGHGHREGDLPPWILKVSATVSSAVLNTIPDFRTLDPTPFLLDDRSIPPRVLAGALGSVIVHILVSLAVGCLAITFRDMT